MSTAAQETPVQAGVDLFALMAAVDLTTPRDIPFRQVGSRTVIGVLPEPLQRLFIVTGEIGQQALDVPTSLQREMLQKKFEHRRLHDEGVTHGAEACVQHRALMTQMRAQIEAATLTAHETADTMGEIFWEITKLAFPAIKGSAEICEGWQIVLLPEDSGPGAGDETGGMPEGLAGFLAALQQSGRGTVVEV